MNNRKNANTKIYGSILIPASLHQPAVQHPEAVYPGPSGLLPQSPGLDQPDVSGPVQVVD